VRSRKNCEALYCHVTLRREIRKTRETKKINKATKINKERKELKQRNIQRIYRDREYTGGQRKRKTKAANGETQNGRDKK
jgi:hypothetical protein